jgi:hypothetical protein
MTPETLAALQAVADTLTKIAGTIRDEGRTAVASQDHVVVIKHFNDLRLVNATVKVAREALGEMEDNLSRVDIPDLFTLIRERTGQKPPFNIEGVGRVTVSRRFSASMLDKEIGMDWLRKNGHGDLIQPTVNAQTLAAFAKNMQEVEGKDLPVEIFKVGTVPYTSITKA